MTKPHRNTHFAVQNIGNTSKNKCWCSSWIAHWRSYTGSRRTRCCVLACGNEAQVGAHVRIMDGRFYKDWYIVPMCKAHNIHHNEEIMFIDRRVTLVPASVSQTCGHSSWWT